MRATGYVRHRVSVTRISRNFPGQPVMTRRLVTMWSRCRPDGVTGRAHNRGRPPVRRTAPGEVRCPAVRAGRVSLDGDGGAGALEGSLGLLRGVLGDLLQDRLRRVVDQVLGLIEAERGQSAHLLDDLDLLVAGSLEDDVELVLLSSLLGATAAATGSRGGRDGHGGSSGDLEGLLELLHEVRQLEEGHLLERVEQVRSGQLGHVYLLVVGQASPSAASA